MVFLGALTLDVKIAVTQEKYLVQYETVLELNCTTKVLRERSDENTYYVTLKLQDANGSVLKDSKSILMPTMHTSFTNTIRYGVKYTSKSVQQRFICKCEATGPSVDIKKDELNVVFEGSLLLLLITIEVKRIVYVFVFTTFLSNCLNNNLS